MLKFETTSASAAMKESSSSDGQNRWAQHLKQPRVVWVMCESCGPAPAAFLCKADSASLCAACDSHIHSPNPLARRHHRIPIPGAEEELFDVDDESASWLLIKSGDDDEVARPPAFLGGEVDEYLDLDEYNELNEGWDNKNYYGVPQTQSSYGGDSIVIDQLQYQKEKQRCFQVGMGYGYPASLSQTVSISSMEVGVVPEPASRPPKGTIDLFSSPPIQAPSQLSPLDREARVLRYREKKKTRRFEKTIRYASRKAYAETRPRIKGRFAKRRTTTVQQVQVDQILSSQCLLPNTIGLSKGGFYPDRTHKKYLGSGPRTDPLKLDPDPDRTVKTYYYPDWTQTIKLNPDPDRTIRM